MLTCPSFCSPSYIYRSPLGFPHCAWSWSYNVPRWAKQRHKNTYSSTWKVPSMKESLWKLRRGRWCLTSKTGSRCRKAAWSEGGNRQNRLHLESRTPSWAALWSLSYLPNIYGNDIPTGKPDLLPSPRLPDGRAPGLVPRLSIA